MHTRIIPAAGAIWESIRYILLALLFTLHFNREFSGEYALFFLWITSYLFLMLAILLLATIRPHRYGVLVKLAGAAKSFQFLVGLLLFLYEKNVFLALRSMFAPLPPGAGVNALSSSVPVISAMVGIDLLFALFLLLYRPVVEKNAAKDNSELPSTHVTEVEDT